MITTGAAAGRTRSRRQAAAAHLDLHERVQLPREPQSGGRPDRSHRYRPGTFINAELDKASEDNERNSLVISTSGNGRIGVVQIAGWWRAGSCRFVREGSRSAPASGSA
jgi:hypothetical protein